jgi:DNA-binding transcriptional LysR family regulator
MARENMSHLVSFVAVARAKSFTKASSKLGVSQSALSHTVRELEERMGLRLLTRTSRSVSTTEAGSQLLDSIGPHLDEIEISLAALTELRDKPAGNFRITTTEPAAQSILWPAIEKLVRKYPDIGIEIVIDYGLADIVSEQYDAGVRLGENIAKDMVAVRIGPDIQMAVVGAPSYFKEHIKPLHPQELVNHTCINLRLQTAGGLYAWEFEKNARALNVRVDGKLVFNTPSLIIKAAVAGLGLACLPDDQLQEYFKEGSLVRVLADWCPSFPGYHLYYPSRRQSSFAFKLLVDALRYRE